MNDDKPCKHCVLKNKCQPMVCDVFLAWREQQKEKEKEHRGPPTPGTEEYYDLHEEFDQI